MGGRAAGFREVVLGHIGRLTPRHTSEIHKRVYAEWGDVSDRATYRALAKLCADGVIVRTKDGYLLNGNRISPIIGG
jgi:DNA-binding PadR family transcriptional regulator